MLLERRTGSVSGGMLGKLEVDKSDVESLFAGKMEMRIRNFGEMRTKMLVKWESGVWSE